MSYVPPDEVVSPQASWKLERVIYDEGLGQIAIACGHYDGRPTVAIRWNGTNEPGKEMGHPQSSAHPIWFMLPEGLGKLVLSTLSRSVWPKPSALREQPATMARDWLK